MELRKGFAGQTAQESSTMTLRPSDAATLCSFASVAVTSPASRRAMAALLVLMRAASSRWLSPAGVPDLLADVKGEARCLVGAAEGGSLCGGHGGQTVSATR